MRDKNNPNQILTYIYSLRQLEIRFQKVDVFFMTQIG